MRARRNYSNRLWNLSELSADFLTLPPLQHSVTSNDPAVDSAVVRAFSAPGTNASAFSSTRAIRQTAMPAPVWQSAASLPMPPIRRT